MCGALSLLVLAFLGACRQDSTVVVPRDEGLGSHPLVVTFLANEGVLLRTEEKAILIDAFVSEDYSQYEALTPAAKDQLAKAQGPFEGIDLALTSHVHRDHFQPWTAAAFLLASPETLFMTSPQVMQELDGRVPRSDNMRVVLPPRGKTTVLEEEGIRVEFLFLPHGNPRFRDVQNLGHLIQVGDMRILHLGDAEVDPKNFASYRLSERSLDVVLVPYWYFLTARGRALVKEHLPSRYTIVVHLPPMEREKFARELRDLGIQAIVPRRRMDTARVPGRRRRR